MLSLKFNQTIKDTYRIGPNCKVYAMVFAPLSSPNAGQALDFSALAIFPFTAGLQIFNGSNTRFGITLTQDPLRTRCFSLQVSGVSLPDSVYEAPYDIEYWVQAASGASNSRVNDILLQVDKMPWSSLNGPGPGEAIILQIAAQTNKIPATPASVYMECKCGLSYDTTNKRIGIAASLESDGQLVSNSKSCQVFLEDSSGNLIFNVSVPVSSTPGIYQGQVLGITLNPDEVYDGTVTVVDSNNVSHVGSAFVVAWD